MPERVLHTVDELLDDIAREQSDTEYGTLEDHVFINGDPGYGKTYLYFDVIPTLEEWLDTFDPDNRDYAHDEDDDG